MKTIEKPVLTKINQWSIKLVKEKTVDFPVTLRSGAAVECLLSFMRDLPDEHFYCVPVNAKLEPIGLLLVSKGTVSQALVHPREVFKGALLANAHSIFVAHNHPTGNPTPSDNDIETTEQLIAAGRVLGVPVIDHMIIGDYMYSFREDKPSLWY